MSSTVTHINRLVAKVSADRSPSSSSIEDLLAADTLDNTSRNATVSAPLSAPSHIRSLVMSQSLGGLSDMELATLPGESSPRHSPRVHSGDVNSGSAEDVLPDLKSYRVASLPCFTTMAANINPDLTIVSLKELAAVPAFGLFTFGIPFNSDQECINLSEPISELLQDFTPSQAVQEEKYPFESAVQASVVDAPWIPMPSLPLMSVQEPLDFMSGTLERVVWYFEEGGVVL